MMSVSLPVSNDSHDVHQDGEDCEHDELSSQVGDSAALETDGTHDVYEIP